MQNAYIIQQAHYLFQLSFRDTMGRTTVLEQQVHVLEVNLKLVVSIVKRNVTVILVLLDIFKVSTKISKF